MSKKPLIVFSVIVAVVLMSVVIYSSSGFVYVEVSDSDRIVKLEAQIEKHIDRIQVLEDKKDGINNLDIDVRIERLQEQIDAKQAIIDSLTVDLQSEQTKEYAVLPDPLEVSESYLNINSFDFDLGTYFNATFGFERDSIIDDPLRVESVNGNYTHTKESVDFKVHRGELVIMNCNIYRYYDHENSEWLDWESYSSVAYDIGHSGLDFDCYVNDNGSFTVIMSSESFIGINVPVEVVYEFELHSDPWTLSIDEHLLDFVSFQGRL